MQLSANCVFRIVQTGEQATDIQKREVAVPKLQDAKELTAPLDELLRELKSELNESKGDFDRLVEITDELGAQADALGETFGSMNETLLTRIQDFRNGPQASSRRKSAVAS
jgi:hypothetical protein